MFWAPSANNVPVLKSPRLFLQAAASPEDFQVLNGANTPNLRSLRLGRGKLGKCFIAADSFNETNAELSCTKQVKENVKFLFRLAKIKAV